MGILNVCRLDQNETILLIYPLFLKQQCFPQFSACENEISPMPSYCSKEGGTLLTICSTEKAMFLEHYLNKMTSKTESKSLLIQ